MVYSWKIPGVHKVAPDVAAGVFDELSKQGELTKKKLVEVSRADDAPLHNEFEWDDTIAAERYRESQAGDMLKHLIISHDDKPEELPQRVFFNIQAEGQTYERIDTIIQRQRSKEALVKQCLRDLISFKMKYQYILKTCRVSEYMDAVQVRMEWFMENPESNKKTEEEEND